MNKYLFTFWDVYSGVKLRENVMKSQENVINGTPIPRGSERRAHFYAPWCIFIHAYIHESPDEYPGLHAKGDLCCGLYVSP